MASYLDKTGLQYLWTKLKNLIDGKSDSDHTHSAATTSSAGMMSAADKTKLDGIATGANAYTHPSYTAKSSGLYKVTVDATGHVSGTAAVAKTDITALGIPAQDTTYSAATTSASGLMSASDKSKLDGIASGANAYTLPVATSSAIGGVKSGTDITVDSSGNVSINDDSHNHVISNIDGLQTALDAKETSGAAATALTDAKAYTDTKISDLINSAPTTLDTLGEIATAMEENADVVEALETAIGTKADASHNHAASEITSGTLAVARGGTGVTANPSMLINLASTSAASVFAASPRPGVTGALPIANGGTGATTADGALTNLGITSITTAEIDALTE